METLGDRIRKFRTALGLRQQDIADMLGESSGRVIYNWEKGVGKPECTKIPRLCEILHITADELLGCKTMNETPTASEWSAIKKFRVLDEHGKEVVSFLLESEYKRAMKSVSKFRKITIDHYFLPASAGTGNFLDSDMKEEITVNESTEADSADYVITVSGNSMEPTFCDGDKVFVQKCDSVDVGNIGIFVLNGDVYIKELGNKQLISHNKNYKPIAIKEDDSIYCCGKVLGSVKE